jgi:HK97 family phage major capsid protein/HK97 family phage prohead protease
MLKSNYSAHLNTRIKQVGMVDDESEDLIIEGYANTTNRDRAGDIIPTETWQKSDALANYYKNPIVLAYHNHGKPIGKTIEAGVTDMGLKIKARISKAAGEVYQLIKDEVLSTFSVGFMIKDANYDPKTDTFYITDLELTEISVVAVPCNQDSTFSVAKSIDDNFESFKQNFSIKKEKTDMDNFDLEQFKKDLLGDVSKAATDAVKAQKEAEKAEADKVAAEKAAKEEAEKSIRSAASSEAQKLIDELQTKLNEKDGAFAEAVKKHEDLIVELKDEIAQVSVARKNPISAGIKSSMADISEKEVDTLVMLGMIKSTDMFETSYGKSFKERVKAVNSSSSIQVSSESYETEFSTNLIRDIQAELVVAPLFDEVVMNAKQMTLPINPDRKNASWVDAADYGKAASTGDELSVALTERTLKTFKLAAKTFLTEETDEDAIIALVPLLRQHLVEAHANEIDRAFLLGSGTGQPKGLVTQATAAGAVQASAAKADGSVLVTAKEILKARRKLGLYGIKLNEIALVVSQDAYWDLLEDSEWGDVQQVGSASTKLNGEVGNIYGMPVIVSNHFAAKAVDTAFAVMVNKTNFMVARQRGATVKTDFDVEKDRRIFVATQRLNLEPLIEATPGSGNGKGVVAITYAAT